MITVLLTDLSVCQPCALAIANGPCDGCESCAFLQGESCPDTAAERQAAIWGEDTIGLVLACDDHDDCDASFSWSACDGCGSPLGGMRHPAAVIR